MMYPNDVRFFSHHATFWFHLKQRRKLGEGVKDWGRFGRCARGG
jgi:hypothetical protein